MWPTTKQSCSPNFARICSRTDGEKEKRSQSIPLTSTRNGRVYNISPAAREHATGSVTKRFSSLPRVAFLSAGYPEQDLCQTVHGKPCCCDQQNLLHGRLPFFCSIVSHIIPIFSNFSARSEVMMQLLFLPDFFRALFCQANHRLRL